MEYTELKKKLERRRFKARDENGNPIWNITASSIVDTPAIEKNFQLFNQIPGVNMFFSNVAEQKKVQFSADEEKMEITGPVMIPNQEILRQDPDTKEFYYCYFEPEDVEAFAEMFLQEANHNQANFNHEDNFTQAIKIKESWFVRDVNNDTANALGFKALIPGTWFITYKVYDVEVWQSIKKGTYKGFSVEINTASFAEQELEAEVEDIIDFQLITREEKLSALKEITEYSKFFNIGELSFKDYPAQAIENAKRVLTWFESNPGTTCGNKLMWTRCKQIANNLPLSYSNLKRISLNVKLEAKANAGIDYSSCPKVVWDAFGGTDLVYWSINKLQQIEVLVKAEAERNKPQYPGATWRKPN